MINGSAIGWYGLRGEKALDETAGAENCFTHHVCEAWETQAKQVEPLGVRLVCMRTGLVLGVEGGVMAKLLTPFEFGLGGIFGTGRHWMSWIALDDMVRAIGFVIANKNIIGPVNMTAPEPVRNEVFTKALGRALNRLTVFRLPEFLLTKLLGDLARETMLGGQKILPKKLVEAGFQFDHIKLEPYFRL